METGLTWWLIAFVIATLVECWFDPIRDAYDDGKGDFWQFHVAKWLGFYPGKVVIWIFVWAHIEGFWWAIGAAALFPIAALVVWQVSKERTPGADWPVLYGVRKFLGLIE